MYKRKRTTVQAYNNRPFKKPRRAALPVRTYGGSRVPLATRGYKFNDQELKVNDIAVANYAVNTTGSITLLCFPVTGADQNARIGRKIQIKSVYVRGAVFSDFATRAPVAAEANPTQQGRMIIVWDTQPNGAVMTIAQLLNTATPLSMLNLDNRDRFKIIKEKVFHFGPSAIGAAGVATYAVSPQSANIKCYAKMNHSMQFNAVNGGTIADVTSGALYMVWIGTTVAGANDITATVSTRVRYSDS